MLVWLLLLHPIFHWHCLGWPPGNLTPAPTSPAELGQWDKAHLSSFSGRQLHTAQGAPDSARSHGQI